MNKTFKKLLLLISFFTITIAGSFATNTTKTKHETSDTLSLSVIQRLEASMKENINLMSPQIQLPEDDIEQKLEDHYRNFIDNIVSSANKFLGTPYRIGGKSPKGFDCSGFTSFIFSRYGITLNQSSRSQVNNGRKIERKEDIQKGDLVFFKGSNASSKIIGHVGIVTDIERNGNIKFIHSATNGGVRISNVSETYYSRRYLTAVRIDPILIKL